MLVSAVSRMSEVPWPPSPARTLGCVLALKRPQLNLTHSWVYRRQSDGSPQTWGRQSDRSPWTYGRQSERSSQTCGHRSNSSPRTCGCQSDSGSWTYGRKSECSCWTWGRQSDGCPQTYERQSDASRRPTDISLTAAPGSADVSLTAVPGCTDVKSECSSWTYGHSPTAVYVIFRLHNDSRMKGKVPVPKTGKENSVRDSSASESRHDSKHSDTV